MTSVTRVDSAAARMDISSLPLDVFSTHILSSEFLPETADLGRLRAVNKGMRDAVDATGREIKKLSNEEAMHLGYVSLLKERHTRGVLKDECLTCAAAARNGDLEELKALRAEKFPWDWETCALAAQYGHLNVLKWARANNCPWDGRTCAGAAKGGHLEMLQSARANNCPWNEWTCRCAALIGHLEVPKWARANCCPWDERTCSFAANGGHLEVLKWARANGCPWDEETCKLAASIGYVET